MQTHVKPRTFDRIIAEPGNLLWVDVEDPSEQDVHLLVKEFRFQPAVLEECCQWRHRPRIQEQEGYLYLVIHALTEGKEGEEGSERTEERESGGRVGKERVGTVEIGLFVGRNYLVSIHRGVVAPLASLRARWEKAPTMMQEGVGTLLYALIDEVLDEYFPVLDRLNDRLEAVEDSLFTRPDQQSVEDLLTLKRDLLTIRKVAAPTRDVVNALMRHDSSLYNRQVLPFFQDLYDHAVRIIDTVDTYRDILSGALEAYLAVASNRMNEVMKVLTAVATILMTLALIAGIYGMNFQHMPELGWRYGYFAVLGGMALIGGVMAYFFHRKRWL